MDDQETVPKKKKKKYGPAKKIYVELSEFEKNVIIKNIEERKEIKRELGLNTLAQDLRKPCKLVFCPVWTIYLQVQMRFENINVHIFVKILFSFL